MYCVAGRLSSKYPVGARAQTRMYALCCQPRREPGTCGCPTTIVPGGGRRIVPPADCRPGPICQNPCCPNFHHGVDTHKKYKYLFFFLMLPLIIIQVLRSFGHELPDKEPCRHYEYMRRFSKRFPWGDGTKSFFFNENVNSLPSDCEIPPYPCEDY